MIAVASPPLLSIATGEKVQLDGKFFRRGGERFFLNGISYGPFAPNSRGEPFPDSGQLAVDFNHIRSLGFNALRLYDLPSEGVLREAETAGLLLLAGIPWTDHVDFLSDKSLCRDIEAHIRDAARNLGAHRQIAAILVGNEIEKTLVRWMEPRRVRSFLERLIATGKAEAPDTLFSYASYPSTEYLLPRNADFVAINVYLEERAAWQRYLRRLQNQAGNKPLVIAEFGIDAQTHGAQTQAAVMRWQRESLIELDAAGNVWFSYTDDWHRGGEAVRRWSFGLVDRERNPRAACDIAPTLPVGAPPRPAAASPRISVIVCTYNGSATLRECLEALGRQRFADFELILVDDGSTDATAEIASSFPSCHYLRQDHSGLSAARNLGASVASGDILAFTDDDCIPDEEWLLRISTAFDDPQWVAAGGPNIPPHPKNRIEAIVAASPGAPVHVLLDDEEAEHLPGCNFCVRKDALKRISGFHREFTTAGDDVDICWRLREAGGRLRFVPGAMVWHHRRFTIRDYLSQQSGYGRAEALLMKHHPSRFGPLGGARWSGGIYGDGLGARDPVEGSVFHGPFGFAPFQAIYPQGIASWWDLGSGVVWILMAALALVVGMPALAAAVAAGSVWAAWLRMRQHEKDLARGSRSDRLLLLMLCWLQPIIREWARISAMIRLGARPSWHRSLPRLLIPCRPTKQSIRFHTCLFWNTAGRDRSHWLKQFRMLAAEKRIPLREDDGWQSTDFELWSRQRWITWAITTVTEYHGNERCLTRVRSSLLIHKGAFVFLALLAAADLALLFSGSAWSVWLAGAVLVMLSVCIIFDSVRWFQFRPLIEQAAQRAGLIRIEHDQLSEPSTVPPPPKTVSKLAPAGESCQSV